MAPEDDHRNNGRGPRDQNEPDFEQAEFRYNWIKHFIDNNGVDPDTTLGKAIKKYGVGQLPQEIYQQVESLAAWMLYNAELDCCINTPYGRITWESEPKLENGNGNGNNGKTD